MRDFERDIIPMALNEGMGLCPFGALGGGNFKTEAQRQQIAKEGNPGRKMVPISEREAAVATVLEAIANRRGTALTSIALAYVMHKAPYVVPIVGGRNVNHLRGNIEALSLELTDQEIEEIESAYPFDMGFPMTFLFRAGIPKQAHPSEVTPMKGAGYFDFVEGPKPIRMKK
jgi:aryl-alcohol dehydrogenase-like predicted oxidoreductase